MFNLGIIGFPVEHSLSPRIHMAALRLAGLQGSYTRFPVPPGDTGDLEQLIARLRSGEQHGLNVTIPHKRSVLALLDGLTPKAEAIGAVNTIYLDDDRVLGDNTDAEGFLRDLEGQAPILFERPNPQVLVLGAGGAAQAVVYALLTRGWQVSVAARRPEQADKLTASFADARLATTDWGLESEDLSGLDLIVNATPLGMEPDVDRYPWPAEMALPAGAVVYDLVYTPRPTRLVAAAQAQGLAAFNGLGMLLEQAALSFERWTGAQIDPQALAVELDL